MGFNEKTHAFIPASYYKYLTSTFGEKGKRAFIHATIYYGEQRGRRMAQRVIKDDLELTFENYLRYSEWQPSTELSSKGNVNKVKVTSLAPSYAIEIHSCPWAETFMEMGLEEAGITYCTYLDESIARGFNPLIAFSCTQTLYKHDFCIQKVENSGLSEGKTYPKKQEYIKDFSYHTAHAFFSYKEVCEAIFKEEGTKIAEKVLNDFKDRFKEEMTASLLAYNGTNFNVC